MTATPAPAPPSDLMVIVLAYKNGEADWPTTKAALLAFPYVEEPASPTSVNDPGYAEWYNADDGILPNSHGELCAAAQVGDLEPDRLYEVTEALNAQGPGPDGQRPRWPPTEGAGAHPCSPTRDVTVGYP